MGTSRKRDHLVVIAALSVASLAVLHALIDLSLQIPGLAIGVFALVGAGLAQSLRSDRGMETPHDPPSTAVKPSDTSGTPRSSRSIGTRSANLTENAVKSLRQESCPQNPFHPRAAPGNAISARRFHPAATAAGR